LITFLQLKTFDFIQIKFNFKNSNNKKDNNMNNSITLVLILTYIIVSK